MTTIKCKAAIALEAKKPLVIEDVYVDPPKAGEVRVKVYANALCHTDIYTLDGHDPEGLFPCILGHEAGAVVVDVGEGVNGVTVGDHVIPCYTPECRKESCIFCASPKTNLCPVIRATQGKGVMPDGTSRFRRASTGETLYHFMGCSTFCEYTVLSELSCARIAHDAPLHKVCLLGCGVATGWGAVWNTCKVEAGASVAVFGLGAVGLAVVQAAKASNAAQIFAIDVNPSKFEKALAFGAHECIDASALEPHASVVSALLARTQWGVDYTFDCTGNTQVMRAALEAAHRGWGVSCVIGVAAAGHEIATRPFQLVTGRVWKGTAFGGWKSRTAVPQLVARVQRGELELDGFITHTYDGIENTPKAIEALHGGACLRAVVRYVPPPAELRPLASAACFGGVQRRFAHSSAVCGCEMTVSVYLPPQAQQGRVPAVVYLSGLTCTDENAVLKSGLQQHAARYGLAVICPDTSPRGLGLPGEKEAWDFGEAASFYVDATEAPWAAHYRMESYVTRELLELVAAAFPIERTRVGVMGHSMGGHGALSLFLKDPSPFRSCSAIAPICHPTDCPWGRKAFSGYLGSVEAGAAHDATLLVRSFGGQRASAPILIDQGSEDKFLHEQLKPEAFRQACAAAGHPLVLRYHENYDHSYYFVATVMEDQLKHHALHLSQHAHGSHSPTPP